MLAFIATDLLLVLTPGPDFALVSRNAMRGGRRAGIATALGANLGLLVWAAATVLGLASLLAASAVAYSIVKYAGAAFLVVLGVWTIVQAARRHGSGKTDPATDDRRLTVGAGKAFRQGLLGSLLSPKSALLYTALLPQFVPTHAPLLPNLLVLAAINSVLALIWFTVCALAFDALARRMRRWLRHVEICSGTVLVGVGIKLAR